MSQQWTPHFLAQRGGSLTLFVGLCLQLVLMLGSATGSRAQGVNLVGVCPTACGINIRITSAKLRERADGIDAVIDWTLEQRAPEIKLKGFKVTATVEFNRLGKDERTVSVALDQRQAVIRLQSGGFDKDIKFSDVTSLKAKVFATADPLSALDITDIRSVKIVGQGNDSAVDLSWRVPTPLACSADNFIVRVKAVNEKGDRLNGDGTAAITARSLRVQLKGDLNKKGLRNPEATVELQHSLIACEQTKNFAPQLEPFGSGTGSNAPNPIVTLKPVKFSDAGSRIDMDAAWDVVEPQGFKATKFDLKFELELANGNIATVNKSAAGNERTVRGPQAQAGDLRGVTVTITATFSNAGNTAILTRTDKRTQPFTAKSIVPKAEPALTPASSVGLSLAGIKINSESGQHVITVGWSVKPPAGVTITSIDVEATALGSQSSVTRSAVASGSASLTNINFAFSEVGAQLKKVQARVTANARRSDGSTFQQIVTGEGQPVVPPPPPPPAVQLKVTGLNSSSASSTFTIRSEWFLQLIPGVTVEGFTAEASILKPTGPIKKTVPINSGARSQNFVFTLTEAEGRTGIAVTVTANLRRADGSTFQEISTRTIP